MPIANYTTTVTAAKTAGEIMGMLAGHGARSIMTQYDDNGAISALAFQIDGPKGPLSISLPVDSESVLRVLEDQAVPVRYRNKDHARRVAWRIIKDWVRAQMALLETEMVRMEEVFLPYIITDRSGETIYQVMASRNFRITMGSKDER